MADVAIAFLVIALAVGLQLRWARVRLRETGDWREYIPFEEGIALLVALVTIVLPLHVLFLHDPGVFGEYRDLKILSLAGIGGAASFALYAGRGGRLLAIAPGLVAGAGAAALSLAFVRIDFPFAEWARALGFFPVIALGATPGFLLLWLLRRAFVS